METSVDTTESGSSGTSGANSKGGGQQVRLSESERQLSAGMGRRSSFTKEQSCSWAKTSDSSVNRKSASLDNVGTATTDDGEAVSRNGKAMAKSPSDAEQSAAKPTVVDDADAEQTDPKKSQVDPPKVDDADAEPSTRRQSAHVAEKDFVEEEMAEVR